MEGRKCERELERCIDSMVDEMSEMYCTELAEDAKLESKMSDIRMRDELIEQIKEVIRCKKISERMAAEQIRKVAYIMQVGISSSGITYTISREVIPEIVSSK